MPLQRLLLLALVLGGSLHATPLSITFLGVSQSGPSGGLAQTYAIDGPRGREIYHIDCCNEAPQPILQNDRWQILIRMEEDSDPPRWHLINYGQGPGEYGIGFQARIGHYPGLFDVPGFAIPDGFCCVSFSGIDPYYRVEFHGLNNSSDATATATFTEVEFQVTPDSPEGAVLFAPYHITFTTNIGVNPYFTPEPGSVILVGLGLFGVWRLSRRGRFGENRGLLKKLGRCVGFPAGQVGD